MYGAVSMCNGGMHPSFGARRALAYDPEREWCKGEAGKRVLGRESYMCEGLMAEGSMVWLRQKEALRLERREQWARGQGGRQSLVVRDEGFDA